MKTRRKHTHLYHVVLSESWPALQSLFPSLLRLRIEGADSSRPECGAGYENEVLVGGPPEALKRLEEVGF